MRDFRWEGVQEFNRGYDTYQQRVHFAVRSVAQYWAAVFESYAKENAPWTDRTSLARGGLRGFIDELSRDVTRLYLSHSRTYGVYLETKYSGKYAIIWPTIERHLEPIRQMLQGIFR